MDIIISGRIGAGKTTVCTKILKLARRNGLKCGGILTIKTAAGLEVLDIKRGERRRLASLKEVGDGPRIGKYSFYQEGIKFGIKAIEEGISCDLLFVDEMGYLELCGEGFAPALALLKGSKASSILVIREELLPDFESELGTLPVFKVEKGNRDSLPEEIYRFITTH